MRRTNRQLLAIAATALVAVGCSEKKYTFEKITCYDRPNLRSIYTPCRQFLYNAKFWDQEYNLITETRVLLSLTGNSQMKQDGKEQVEGIYQYEYKESDFAKAAPHNINTTLPDTGWVQQMPQGLAETGQDVWMTPFRQNQFKFTQVSPYPSVNLPLEDGKQWHSNLIMYGGWGDWDNQRLRSNYEVLGKETVELPMGVLEDVWHVNAIVNMNLGYNTLDMWFSEEYGFVKLIYKNYGGQLAQFEMTEVIERGL